MVLKVGAVDFAGWFYPGEYMKVLKGFVNIVEKSLLLIVLVIGIVIILVQVQKQDLIQVSIILLLVSVLYLLEQKKIFLS